MFFVPLSLKFFSPSVCSFRAVFIGAGGRDRPYLCPIVVHGERGHHTLPRCRARWPIGASLAGHDSLVFHHPLVSHHKRCGLRWVLGFDSVWAGGGGERSERKQKEKTKCFSSPVACTGEEEEEEQCRIKWHCFIFFLYFFCVGTKKWVTTGTNNIFF